MTVTAKPPSTQDRISRSGRDGVLTRILVRQEVTLLLVTLVIGVFAASRSDLFLSQDNLTAVLRNSVVYFVMACGAALLVIGGGLDFSAGAVFTLGALSTCRLLVEGVPWPAAVLVGMAICCAVGAVNFAVVTYLHVPPIIATLGTFYTLTGIDNLVTDGSDVVPLPASFERLAQGSVLGVSNDVLIAVAVGVLFWFLLERTRFGVNVRALGGNRQAAVGNGLRVVRLDLALYAIAAATAGLAGVVYSAQVGAGQVTAGGTSTTLNAITAVLIGGVSLKGGMGGVQGVAVGAVLLSLIDKSLVTVLEGSPRRYRILETLRQFA
ncbi:MAG TPA: ABC transporter permease, partial [Umezawaea sp.]|nr:ABC transporter permease [Umezawaea sp.]